MRQKATTGARFARNRNLETLARDALLKCRDRQHLAASAVKADTLEHEVANEFRRCPLIT